MKTIRLNKLMHKGKERLFLEFKYDNDLIAIIRSIEGMAWSQTRKACRRVGFVIPPSHTTRICNPQ